MDLLIIAAKGNRHWPPELAASLGVTHAQLVNRWDFLSRASKKVHALQSMCVLCAAQFAATARLVEALLDGMCTGTRYPLQIQART